MDESLWSRRSRATSCLARPIQIQCLRLQGNQSSTEDIAHDECKAVDPLPEGTVVQRGGEKKKLRWNAWRQTDRGRSARLGCTS